jgi:hypothetical protein
MNSSDATRTLELLVRYVGYGILAAMVVRLMVPVTISYSGLGYTCQAPGVFGAYAEDVGACRSVGISRVYDSMLWFGIAIALLAVANVLDRSEAERESAAGAAD